MIVDTHAHLSWPDFKDDFPEVLQRSFDAGVKTIINVGADLQTSEQALHQAQDKLPVQGITLYSTIGLHPHESSRLLTNESIQENIIKLERIYQENPQKVVAVGECGLDYYFEGNTDFTPSSVSENELKKLQMELFKEQINLAKRLNIPLIIHNRDAWTDILIPELEQTRGVFHSFRGTQEQAQQVLDLGYYLGITCVITYPKNEQLREVVKKIPLESLLVETDCPYLPPQSKRGQRNEPASVTEVIKTIAQVKNLTEEQVAKPTFQNAQKLFRLPIQ